MAKSIASKILICVLGLAIVAGIIAIVYFFIIKNDNIREQVFEDFTATFDSVDEKTLENNIGGLNGGEYSSYSINVPESHYDQICLQYLTDKQILNAYKNELLYIGNVDNAKVKNIQGFLDSYKKAREKTLESQRLFNENKADLGTSPDENERAALARTFVNMTNDFKAQNLEMRKLTAEMYNYVTSFYYKNIDAFQSEKFVRVYALERQAEIYNNALIDLDTMKNATYTDTKQMCAKFMDASSKNFAEQSTSLEVMEFIEIFSTDAQCNYDDVLNSDDKVTYVNNIVNADNKNNYIKVITNLGIEWRS